MEPVSAIASILAVAAAAFQVSKALNDTLKDIQNAPSDISRLSDDIRSISAILSSLQATLKDKSYWRILEDNPAIVESLKHLESPLKSCANIITAIEDRIAPCLGLLESGKGSKLSKTKWLWNKHATRDLITIFESTKHTLNIHLTNVSVQCNLHIVALQPRSLSTTPRLTRTRSSDTDAGLALRRYIAASTNVSDDGRVGTPGNDPDEPSEDYHEEDDPMAVIAQSIKDSERQQDLLFDAIRLDRVDLIRRLLAGGANIDAIGSNGNSALYTAVELRNERVIKVLLNESANTEFAVTSTRTIGTELGVDGETPLHCAARGGLTSIVKLLLQAKVDPDARTMTAMRTPLQDAISRGNTKTAKVLIEGGADIMAGDWEDWTPLHCAVYHSNVDITRILIDHGANIEAVTSSQNSYGLSRKRWLHTTPLFLAAWNGDAAITKMLLAANADPRAQILDGATTLHAAVYGQRATIAIMLLDAEQEQHRYTGKTFIDMQRANGDTALHVAASKAMLDFVELLMARNADKGCFNSLQETPLRAAQRAYASKQKKKVIEILQSCD
ncbi:MAG: hypothetical protein Q9181_002167 [Wetmoreana brouardii]